MSLQTLSMCGSNYCIIYCGIEIPNEGSNEIVEFLINFEAAVIKDCWLKKLQTAIFAVPRKQS